MQYKKDNNKLIIEVIFIEKDKIKLTNFNDINAEKEIEEIAEKMNISEESIKLFIKLINEEKVELSIEHHKDIYLLSEHFCIPTITAELDDISPEEIFKDLNFTLQILHDFGTEDNDFKTELVNKIENVLRARINECISNSKFRELDISTIFLIIELSKIDHNLLVDFIFESAPTRFVIFKLVEIDKLSDDKVYDLIKFIDEQEEARILLLLNTRR